MIRILIILVFILSSLMAISSANAEITSYENEDNDQKTWSVNLSNVDIKVLTTQVSNITGKSFIIDPMVKGKVTVVSTTPITKEEVYDLFLSVLSVHGYVAIASGKVIKIVPKSVGKRSNSSIDRLGISGDSFVTRVIPVKTASVTELIRILRPLVEKDGYIDGLSTSNSIVVTDHADNVNKIVEMLNRLDFVKDDLPELIPLKEASVREVVKIINKLLGYEDGNALNKGFKRINVIADERSNTLIVKGDHKDKLKIRALVRDLDKPADESNSTQVIYVKYANVKDLAQLLKDLITSEDKDDGALSTAIQADESLNALVIRADQGVMSEIKKVVAKLDVKRAQVLIEAAIVEVTGDLAEQIGLQLAGGNAALGGDLGATSFSNAGVSLGTILGSLGTGQARFLGEGLTGAFGNQGGFSLLVQALSTSANANLLSTPSITTLDNKEAKIVVGQNVPFVTGSFTDLGGGENPFTTIQREDVGITLKVLPHIYEGDTVRLDVEQEVSTVVDAGISGAADIITNKRTIDTTIVADDGETIVLGGLIQDDVVEVENKVPLLGDIPLVGNLFKSVRDTNVKRNLLVFLRPTILRSKGQVSKLSKTRYDKIQKFKAELDNNEAEGLSYTPAINELYEIDGLPWLSKVKSN